MVKGMPNTEKLKINQDTRLKRKNGGARPGSGRKPGQLGLKARTLLEVRNRIAEKADDILNAELLEALGSFVVMKADPETLDYRQVTDEKEIIRFIQEYKGANGRMNGHVYIITAKTGNYKAREYLLDRAFGRPSQAVEIKQEPTVLEIAREVVKTLVDDEGMPSEKAVRLTSERYKIPETELISNAVN